MEEIKVKPLTNQKLWNMAKEITNALRMAKEHSSKGNIDYTMLEELWFDWLLEELTEQ